MAGQLRYSPVYFSWVALHTKGTNFELVDVLTINWYETDLYPNPVARYLIVIANFMPVLSSLKLELLFVKRGSYQAVIISNNSGICLV